MGVRKAGETVSDFVHEIPYFVLGGPRRAITTLLSIGAVITYGSVELAQQIDENHKRDLQESGEIVAKVKDDGFAAEEDKDTVAHKNDLIGNVVRISGLKSDRCNFHDVEARASIRDDHIVDVQEYSLTIGEAELYNRDSIVEGGVTVTIDNARQLQDALPALDCQS